MPWINGKNDRSTADENPLQAEVAVELSGSYYGNRRIIAKFSLIYQYFLADRVDLVLLIFGLAALAGIWVTGKLVDHFLRLTVLASLALFGLITLIFALDAQSAIVIYAGTAVWGLTFGGAATLLQTALADAAGASADTALAMNVVAWNGALAAGGFMLETWGATVFPWAMFALILVGFMLAWSARAYGFPVGSRTGDVAFIGH